MAEDSSVTVTSKVSTFEPTLPVIVAWPEAFAINNPEESISATEGFDETKLAFEEAVNSIFLVCPS